MRGRTTIVGKAKTSHLFPYLQNNQNVAPTPTSPFHQKMRYFSNQEEEKDISIYIHWPYCKSICPYCDFNRYLHHSGIDVQRMEKSYKKELDWMVKKMEEGGKGKRRRLKSVFIGGGTPSTAPPSLLSSLLSHCFSLFPLHPSLEVTIEANPTTIEMEKMEEWRKGGVNRISIGVQSLREKSLEYLGRKHTAGMAKEAIKRAKDIFPFVSFDLIYAINEEQTAESWKEELEEGLALGANHLSLYTLIIEPHTPFHHWFHNNNINNNNNNINNNMNKNKNKNIKIEEEGEEGGEGEEEGRRVTVPGEEEAADMYEKTLEVTGQWGYHQYEVSNFAKSEEEESKHNKVYWRSGEWIGIGPGAASRLNISSPSLSSSSPSLASSTPSLSFPFSPSSSSPSFSRISFSQHRTPEKWMNAIEENGHGVHLSSSLSPSDILTEVTMMGLRTRYGVENEVLEEYVGERYQEIFNMQKMKRMEERGLMRLEEKRMVASPRGLSLLNSLLPSLLSYSSPKYD